MPRYRPKGCTRMERRTFLKSSLLTLGAGALPHKVEPTRGDDKPLGTPGETKVGTPQVQIPPYLGSRYDDTIPDALDIAERAKLEVNGLTGITDSMADHEIFWFADFHRDPPVMIHAYSD